MIIASAGDESSNFAHGPTTLVLPVPGSPLQAQQIEYLTRTLSDGTSSTVSVTSSVYRDEEGRICIECSHHPNLSSTVINLIDPVARSFVTLLADAKTAIFFVKPHSGVGPFDFGLPTLGVLSTEGAETINAQELGTRVIEGIEVQGARATRILNGRLTTVRETWWSRLSGVTMSISVFGQSWKHTAKLQMISNVSPDPLLFVVSDTYTVDLQ